MAIDFNMAQRIVDLLNDAIISDRAAIAALVANRVPCTKALANHGSIQVAAQNGGYHVGLLGILNGICGADECGRAAILPMFDEPSYGRFANLLGFRVERPAEIPHK